MVTGALPGANVRAMAHDTLERLGGRNVPSFHVWIGTRDDEPVTQRWLRGVAQALPCIYER